jgi:hypothetical protein
MDQIVIIKLKVEMFSTPQVTNKNVLFIFVNAKRCNIFANVYSDIGSFLSFVHFLVGWHAGAVVSLPPGDIIFCPASLPYNDFHFCFHLE